jgi:SHS2 domain-containing protein
MRSFQILEHTSDIRLKLKADSYAELFLAALEGMNSVIKGGADFISVEPNLKVELKSLDISMLLVEFLSEILLLSEKNKCLYFITELTELTDYKINCIVSGFHPEAFAEDIKAVTYTEVNIIKNSSGLYETNLVFDI